MAKAACSSSPVRAAIAESVVLTNGSAAACTSAAAEIVPKPCVMLDNHVPCAPHLLGLIEILQDV